MNLQLFNKYILKNGGDSLQAKCIKGSMILVCATFFERVMRLIRNMVLARLISPEDFGLMAIIMAVLMVLESLTDVGVRQSVIHNKCGYDEEYLNVAWWFQSVRGTGLFIIAFFVSPLICHLYEKPELLNLLRMAFLGTLFMNLASAGLFVLEKEFRFIKAVTIIQGSALLGTMLAILLAFYFKNVWVLVIGRIFEGFLRFFLSFVLCPILPKLNIDRIRLKELLQYSKGMIGLSFLTIIAMQTDVFVLAKLLPTYEVGMYSLALSLAIQPVALFEQTFGRTLLPAFALRQDSNQDLRRILSKVIRIVWIVGVPLFIIVTFLSGQILSVIYGQKYTEVASSFAILSWVMFFRIQGSIFANVYLAIGKPHIHRCITALLSLLIIMLIYPGIMIFGLKGAALVLLVSNIIAVFMQVIWMKKTIGLRFNDFVFCRLSQKYPFLFGFRG